MDQSFASALWVLQTLFAFARTGADGVNITPRGFALALFKFHDAYRDWSAVAYPEYYGMRMFPRRPPRITTLSVAGPQRARVHAWATRAPGGGSMWS